MQTTATETPFLPPLRETSGFNDLLLTLDTCGYTRPVAYLHGVSAKVDRPPNFWINSGLGFLPCACAFGIDRHAPRIPEGQSSSGSGDGENLPHGIISCRSPAT